jgi:hypothetical protein
MALLYSRHSNYDVCALMVQCACAAYCTSHSGTLASNFTIVLVMAARVTFGEGTLNCRITSGTSWNNRRVAMSRMLVGARFKAWGGGRSRAGIVGSNPVGCMAGCRECCVLSGAGLCDELVTRSDESYRSCVI